MNMCVCVEHACGDALIKCPHWYTAALWGQTNWSIVQQMERKNRETERVKEGWSWEGQIDDMTAVETEGERVCITKQSVHGLKTEKIKEHE